MRMFAKNIRTFLLALVLGVSVWVSAVSAADPNEVRTYPRPIPIEVIGQDPSLVLINEIPKTMEVSLRAPHSVWEMLTTREDAVHAILSLSGLSAGKHDVNIQVTVAMRPYQILLKDPSTVTVDLDTLTTKTFPLDVSISGQAAAGYESGAATPELKQVTVSGPESIIQQVTRARVPVNLDGVRESIDESIPVQLLDAQGKILQDLTVNPEMVRVTVPVSQQSGFRDVAVKVIVQGQQAAGYRIENISVFPQVVTVFAKDPKLVNQLPGVVETQPLNLQDRKEDISTRLALDLPSDITIQGAQTVQVQVSISPVQTSLPLPNLPINVNGLSEGLAAQVFPQTVDVILSGPLPILDTLTAKDITVSVNTTGLLAGTYQLTPEVKVSADNVLVESILPGTVEVVISVPVTPTQTLGP